MRNIFETSTYHRDLNIFSPTRIPGNVPKFNPKIFEHDDWHFDKSNGISGTRMSPTRMGVKSNNDTMTCSFHIKCTVGSLLNVKVALLRVTKFK